METWKPVVGYEEIYSVSDLGRVRRDAALPKCYAGRICKPYLQNQGYLLVSLSVGGISKAYLLHRLVLIAFVGPPPDGMECNHIDGCSTNNALTNLEWISPSENSLHAHRVLGRANGLDHHTTTLTTWQVAKIKGLLAQGVASRILQAHFRVSADVITDIRCGRCWKDVPTPTCETFTLFDFTPEPELMLA